MINLYEQRMDLFKVGSPFAPAQKSEIVGIDNILDRLDPVIFWLKNRDLDIRVEPGLLFEGTPGTGKTLCARYLAGQSNARFINVRDWPLMNDMMVATDIKDLFQMARSYYQKHHIPVILFWDEFESYATDRAAGGQRNAAIVSQLTAELDGIMGKCPGVLLVGCTNYKESIDPALTRSGRMGMQFSFRAPDRIGKQKLLEYYLRKYPKADIDLEGASYFFLEDTPASEIEEACNRVWLNAVLKGIQTASEPVITNEIISDTLLSNLVGDPPPFLEMDDKSRFHAAVHEIGHALVARYLNLPVRFVTIKIGDTLGKTLVVFPNENLLTVNDSVSQVVVGFGGIWAERTMSLPNLLNSQKDLYESTSRASKLTGTFGVEDTDHFLVDFFAFDLKNRSVFDSMSENLKRRFDVNLVTLIEDCSKRAMNIIQDIGASRIQELAQKLMTETTWTGKDFEERCQELMIP